MSQRVHCFSLMSGRRFDNVADSPGCAQLRPSHTSIIVFHQPANTSPVLHCHYECWPAHKYNIMFFK